MQKGKFITLEGVDGAGKSTHIPVIAELLRKRGREVLVTREPGGTPLGEKLRELLLSHPMHAETETMLMFAARREHIEQVIKPALSRGSHVLSDRFTDATFAYQSGGRGVSSEKVRALEQWVQGDFQPDMTLLFDLPVAISVQRLAGVRHPDRFERENAEFFERIRRAYLERAAEFPQRFRIVDASLPIPEVHKSLEQLLSLV
ncbi:MAG: dTMP kinase [Nitrosomonadales bacterium]|nr:MAG: dTMP kinase [Nitrosomonadales bacterium]